MSILNSFKKGFTGIAQSLRRYPVTIFWLLAVATINTVQIQKEFNMYNRWLFTALTGAMLSLVAQHIYERFMTKQSQRWALAFGSVVLAILYYFTLPGNDRYEFIYPVRTGVLLFALFIAFIWIPTIKKDTFYFHNNFLTIFKAAMMTTLMAAVLAIGVSAILASVNFLLFDIDYRINLHAFNIIGTLFATIYFLSLIPDFTKNDQAVMEQATAVPRFLEILLIYIVIPLVAVYTIVLVAYVAINIAGEFWTNNLLEPLLVSYAVIGIIVYLLVSNIDHKFSKIFQRIFPKIMLVVVVFQTAASILRIQDFGVTHGRYYVIMFCVFATVAAVIFSFLPKTRSGLIAPILVVLSIISVTPMIDAFTVGRNSQENLLEQKLRANEMLVDDTIIPNGQVSVEDKIAITRSVDYLTIWGGEDQVSFLPDEFETYKDFKKVFGFDMTYSTDQGPDGQTGKYVFLDWQLTPAIPLDGADYMSRINIYQDARENYEVTADMFLRIENSEELILEKAGTELIRFELRPLFDRAFENASQNVKGGNVPLEFLMETKENDQVKLTVVISQLEEYDGGVNGELLVLITLK